jgi:hypothetical protein
MKLKQLYINLYRSDPKPIPPRSTRRSLVVVISALMVASTVLTAVASNDFALLAVLLVGPAYIVFARKATRNMITASNTAPLDEWQRDQVVQAKRTAFTLVSATMLVLGLVPVLLTVTFHVAFAPVPFQKLAWLLFLTGVYLFPWTPVAILAWRLPDEVRPAGMQQ